MRDSRIYLLAIIGILLIIIWYSGCNNKPIPGKLEYKYKTDAIYGDQPFKPSTNIKEKTKPLILIEWKKVRVPYKVEVIPDSLKLLIRNLEDSLASIIIDKEFLTNFPKASKLINFDLFHDTLNITLMGIDGKTKSHIYPMDFHNYKYQWYDNELHHKESKYKDKKDNAKFKQLYLDGGYDFFNQSPLLDMNYQINMGRLRLTASSGMYINSNPQLNAQLKMGIRLLR